MSGARTIGERPRAGFLLLYVAFMGCMHGAPAVPNRLPGNQIAPRSVAAAPPQVFVYTLDVNDDTQLEDSATGEIAGRAMPVLNGIMEDNGAHVVAREKSTACGVLCEQFFRWGGIASLEIGMQRHHIQTLGFHSVGDWRFPLDLSALRQAFEADFALFVVLKQTRRTAARVMMEGLARMPTMGKQIDVACIYDLRDGRMVWCATESDDYGDLSDPGRVSFVFSKLLREVFRVPPLQPPPSINPTSPFK